MADKSGDPGAAYEAWLQGLQANTLASRDMRRAALNLLEDAVEARRAAELDSERRQSAERSLRDTEARLRRTVAATGVALFEWDLETDRFTGNPRFHALFGSSPDDEGTAVAELRRKTREHLLDASREETEWERPAADASGWLLVRVHVEGPGGPLVQATRVFGTAIDITDRKQAEDRMHSAREELERRVAARTAELLGTNQRLAQEVRDREEARLQVRSLLARLIDAQEDERKAIARDVHDQLGQQVTALRMNLEAMGMHGAPLQLSALIERTQMLAADLDESIDFLSWQLRPSALDHLGLAAALASLVHGWSVRFGTQADFEAAGCESLRLTPAAEANLYRLVQEALHNVQKHANARHVRVRVACEDDIFTVRVCDDGRGFDTAAPLQATSFGLTGMRERAALIGGEMTVESAPGQGTAIVVRVPMNAVRP